jgi:predicted O-methyltransferase YrrM
VTVSGYRLQGLINRAIEHVTHMDGSQLSLIAPLGGKRDLEGRDEAESVLLTVALRAAALAPSSDVALLTERCRTEAQRRWANEWPGEHYRLLPAIAKEMGVDLAIEVGTHTGMGSVALLAGAKRVITYDIAGWSTIADSVLREEDFASGRVEQRLGDLADESFFSRELETLRRAQLIFVDGPKDRSFEVSFTARLMESLAGSGIVVIYDDIRVLNMVTFWDRLQLPKLDLTSFGHWSGTGLARL